MPNVYCKYSVNQAGGNWSPPLFLDADKIADNGIDDKSTENGSTLGAANQTAFFWAFDVAVPIDFLRWTIRGSTGNYYVAYSNNGTIWSVLSALLNVPSTLTTVASNTPGTITAKYFRILMTTDSAAYCSDFRLLYQGVPYEPYVATTLTAVGGVGANKISLSWTDIYCPAYKVYKYNSLTGVWVLLGTTTNRTFEDYQVSQDIFYFYYVVGLSSSMTETYPSNVASDRIQRAGVFSMAESRATVFQGIQVGIESTPGTLVAATKRILNLEMNQVPQIPVNVVRHAGFKGASGTQKGQRHTEARFNGPIDFNVLPYLATLAYGQVSPSVDANTVKMYTWRWNPSATDPLTPKSATFEQGSSKGAEKFGYATVQDLALKWAKEDASVEGLIFGGAQTRNATMTPGIRIVTGVAASAATSLSVTTPGTTTGTIPNGTYVTNLGKVFVFTGGNTITAGAATLTVTALAAAITAGEVAFTLPELDPMAADPAAIGVFISLDGVNYTQLLDTLDGQINLNGLWKPSFHVNDAFTSFDRLAELNPAFGATITTEEGTEANNYMSYLDNGTKCWLGLRVMGPTINTSPLTRHMIRLNIPMLVTKPDPGDKNDVYGNTFTFEHAHDLAFGMFDLTVQNKLAAL